MKVLKNNAKSVRMTDAVLAYVESMDGKGFNEKFENMVLYAMKTEKDREHHIAILDDEIARKRDMLYKLRQMEDKLVWIQRTLNSLGDQVSGLIDNADKV
ncbi:MULTISPECIES: hypothetical protein [Blautia]|uniref:hypothetical protein n=1 Tax=Blautia TaxID=572511 RepID=UPI000BA4A71C|nr:MULTISPECIES: hypothetical protein [Blautia]